MIGGIKSYGISKSSSGIAPHDISNLRIEARDERVNLYWSDPEDTIATTGETVCAWAGTKVVYKLGSYPTSETDGVQILDNQVRDAYKTDGFTINNLTNDQTYYFALFPYSDTGAVNISENNKISATPIGVRIYGIKRSLTTSDTAWERIEDAVNLVANATHDGNEVENDFDNLYPWNEITSYNYDADNAEITAWFGDSDFSFDGSNGEVMTRIPEFWWKRIQDDEYEYIYIANGELDGYTHSEAFSLSRYTASGSSSRLYSKSGATPLGSVTQANFRTYAKNIGMRLLDIWAWSKLQMLYLVEYADYDCQTTLGNGNSSSGAILDSGGCDDLGMKSGCLADDNASAVIYRGIENIFGNVRQACDGVSVRYSTNKPYVCTDSDSYSSASVSSPYTALGYACPTSSDGYIKTLRL